MEDFSIDNFTLDDYGDYYIGYYDSSYDYIDFSNNSPSIQFVATCIIICIALPLTLAAIYALYRLVCTLNLRFIYLLPVSRVCCTVCLSVHLTVKGPDLALFDEVLQFIITNFNND